MRYPTIKIVLKHHELQALTDLMSLVIHPEGIQGVKSRLVICLMQGLYARLDLQSRFVKSKHKVSIPVPEALAFKEYWLGEPMRSIVSGALINRIIGEVDQKTNSIIL